MNAVRGRKAATLAVAVAVIGAMVQAPADTVADGPAFPAPGGSTWVGEGNMARTGGADWSYTDLDMSLFLNLWWGPWGADGLGLAFDGAIDGEGETLAYSATSSDLEGGVAVFLGSAPMNLFTGSIVLPTRLMITSPDPLDFEAAAGVEGPGALVPVSGDYAVHLAFEAFHGGSWQPALDLYDALHQADQEPGAVISVGFGYYYILNQAPEATITSDPETPVAEQAATVSANATDVDGTVELIEWDLDNDGEFDDGTGETVSHTFPAKGDYDIQVRVTDDRGLSSTAAAVITVVRCDEGLASGAVHDVVEPVADGAGAGGDVHDVNCAIVAGLGL